MPIAFGLSSVNMVKAEETITLDTVNVSTDIDDSKANHSEKKTVATIQRELIENNKDLVRYSTDVGVVDQG